MSDCITANAIELRLSNFTFTPVGRHEPVLTNFSIDIAPGERVLLTGASGSGKSTIIKALAGLIPADGTDPEYVEPTKHAAYMVQNPVHALVNGAAGLDIAFAPENQALSSKQIRSRVSEARAQARFWVPLERDPFRLSGGQQQRLALAGVLAAHPSALLLDEPLTMLDPTTSDEVRDAIVRACTGKTLVVADHHVENWVGHVDRIVQIGEGGLIESCTSPAIWEAEPNTKQSRASQAARLDSARSPILQIAPVRQLAGRTLFAEPAGLEIAPGWLYVISGPSGVGKSTFLRHVLEQSRETSSKQFTAAYLPQNPEKLFVATSVDAEVRAGAAAEIDCDHIMDELQITHLKQANPFAVSGGEQRRVAFASALASGRKVLVLDEPTVGLDKRAFDSVLSLIAAALKDGRAVVAATHDPRLVECADEHLVLQPAAGREDMELHNACVAASATSSVQEVECSTRPEQPQAGASGSSCQGLLEIPPVPRLPRPVPADAFNQLTILLIAAAAFAGSFTIHSLWAGIAGSVIALITITLAYRTRERFLMRFVPILFATASIAWSAVILSGHNLTALATWKTGAVEGLRIFSMVAPGAFLMESIEPTRLGQALAQKLRVPARFAAAMTAGLSRLGHMFGEWESIMLSRRVRGIHARNPFRLYASATFALLVSTLRGAAIQALAMDARGFANAHHRSWTHASRFTCADLWGCVLAVIVCVVPIVVNLLV